MTKFSIKFEDTLPEVTGGTKIKPNWDTGGWGEIASPGLVFVSENGLLITGTSRLSIVERTLSAGVLGQIFVRSFFQSLRQRRENIATGGISKIVTATRPKRITLSNGTILTSDIVHIFVEKDDGSRDIHAFSFSTLDPSLVSRPAFWLFWGSLAKIMPDNKLELQSEELKQEISWEHGHSYAEEEMQRRIANAVFMALPLVEGTQQLFDEVADPYKGFEAVGRQVALGMLSADDWRIRAAASSCLSKVGMASDADAMLPLLKDEHPLVRVSVIQSLINFPSDRTQEALQALSQDIDKRVRRAIEDALKTIAKAK